MTPSGRNRAGRSCHSEAGHLLKGLLLTILALLGAASALWVWQGGGTSNEVVTVPDEWSEDEPEAAEPGDEKTDGREVAKTEIPDDGLPEDLRTLYSETVSEATDQGQPLVLQVWNRQKGVPAAETDVWFVQAIDGAGLKGPFAEHWSDLALRRGKRFKTDLQGRVVLPAKTRQQRIIDMPVQFHFHSAVDNGGDFLGHNLAGQAKNRDPATHHAAQHFVAVVERNPMAIALKLPGNSQSRRTTTHHGHSPAGGSEPGRQGLGLVLLTVRGAAFEMADRHWPTGIGPLVTAGALAGPGTDPSQDSGKHVILLVDPKGLVRFALGDQPDILRHIGSGRAGVLAWYVPGDSLQIQRGLAETLEHRSLQRISRRVVFDLRHRPTP